MKPISSFFTPNLKWELVQPQVSKWGKRSYSVQGFSGHVTLNQIVKIYKKQNASFDKATVAREVRNLNEKGKQKVAELTKTYRLCRIFHAIRSAFGGIFFSRKKVLQEWEKSDFSANWEKSDFSANVAVLREKIDSFDPKGKFLEECYPLFIHDFTMGVEVKRNREDLSHQEEFRRQWLAKLEQLLVKEKEVREKIEEIASEKACIVLNRWVEDVKNIVAQERNTPITKNFFKNQVFKFCIQLNCILESITDQREETAQFMEAASQFIVESGNTPKNRRYATEVILQKYSDYLLHRGIRKSNVAKPMFSDHLFKKYFHVFSTVYQNKNLDINRSEAGWLSIAEIDHSPNHFFNMCFINGKKMYCDNYFSPTWSSEKEMDVQVIKICIREEKLKELGNVINQHRLVIPYWKDGNCWLSSAWIAFSIFLEYNRRLNALEQSK